MLVYYFLPFIVNNHYLLFQVSSGHNSVTVQNRTHVHMNFFAQNHSYYHIPKQCRFLLNHPVYLSNKKSYCVFKTSCIISVLFYTKPCLSQNFIIFCSNFFFSKSCVKFKFQPCGLKVSLLVKLVPWQKHFLWISNLA